MEHSVITDPDIHEPKGASTATTGQILVSNGDGTTSWVGANTLDIISHSSISNSSSAIIAPSAVDTPVVASFGSTVSNADVTMDSSGVITINTDGYYEFTFNFNFGRTTSTSTAYVLARLLVNDAPFGFVQGCSLSSNNNSRPSQANLGMSLVDGDTLKIQVMRDSAGQNDGGLHPIAVVDAGWGDVPSYWARVVKVEGAV